MGRQKLVILVAGLLCLVAVGMAAGTLTTAVGVDGEPAFDQPSSPLDNQQDSGAGDSENFTVGGGVGTSDDGIKVTRCIEELTTLPAMFGLFLLFTALLTGSYRWKGPSFTVLAGAMLAPPILFMYFILTNCADGFMGGGPAGGSSISTDGGGQLVTTLPTQVWLIFGFVLAVAVLGGVGLLYSSEDSDSLLDEEETGEEEEDVSGVGRVAGEAADRIESNADVSNAVFRAWRDMTEHLHVDQPKTSTPGEFRDTAIDAGMAEEDITELTELFEDVRYGGREASEEREERALEIFRHIETEYAEDTDEEDPETDGTGQPSDRGEQE